jgi:hypothetical protein
MRRLILLAIVLTLVISAVPASTDARVVVGFRSALPTFASSTVQTSSNVLTTAVSVVASLTAHSSSWFSKFAPSRSLMLVLGGSLLLFGAFLRRRPALRRPRNQRAEVGEGQAGAARDRALDDSRMGNHIEPPSPHVVSSNNESPTQGTLAAFLTAQRARADQVVGKETR